MSELNKPHILSLPLDYFKRPTRVGQVKTRLGWWALGLSLGGVILSGLFTREVHLGASPGHVSYVHNAWDQTCSACHEPFQVISSHSWAPPGMVHSSGQTCQTCHAGPAHHPGQTTPLNCASCHREHQGENHSLLKIGDADCTQCHRDLQSHYLPDKRPTTPRYADVTHFSASGHPPFRSIKQDTGKIRFNHAQHMSPGMPPLPLKKDGAASPEMEGAESIRGTFTLGQIPEEFRVRYSALQAEKGLDALVQLTCRTCHQLDSSDFALTPMQVLEIGPLAKTPRGIGAYFLPINYENQCQACHPLGVSETKFKERAGEEGIEEKLSRVPVPHGRQPAEMEAWLTNYFIAQAAQGNLGFWEAKVSRPFPGKIPEKALTPDRKKLVDSNLERARKDLFLGGKNRNCTLCHTLERDKKLEKEEGVLSWKEFSILPGTIPQIWYEHALFDHSKHRAVDCRECHAAAYGLKPDGAQNPGASRIQGDVMIPDLDNCVQCHAPSSTRTEAGVTRSLGGVRFDCVLCHQYHNGDHPLAGRGAASRGASVPRNMADFLKGVLKK